MFVILQLKKSSRRGIIGKIIDKIKPYPIEYETKQILKAKYAVITAVEETMNWNEILDTVNGNRLLLPERLQEKYGYYEPQKFNAQILFNTASSILSRLSVPLYSRTIGLVDCNGIFQCMVVELLKYCTTIKILTHKPNRYELFSTQIMDVYGAPIILCDSMTSMNDCLMVICPQDYYVQEEINSKIPILTSGKVTSERKQTIVDKFTVKSPESIREQLPPEISEHEFVGALFELSGARELGRLTAYKMMCGNREIQEEEICNYLSQQSEKSVNFA